MRPLFLIISSLLAGASQAEPLQVAQLQGMSLGELLQVDISTGTSKFLHEAPATAYVLTAEDIRRSGARNLTEALNAIPGLYGQMLQGGVYSPILVMRGSYSSNGGQILYLRDGKVLRAGFNATMVEVFRMPIHLVERIEVIRGPAAAVYGADALAGAINIVSKKQPDEAGVHLGEDFRSAWLGRSGTAGPVEWSAAVSYGRLEEKSLVRSSSLARTFSLAVNHDYADIDLKLSAGPFRATLWALNSGKLEQGHPNNRAGRAEINTQNRHQTLSYHDQVGEKAQLDVTLGQTTFTAYRQAELRGTQPFDDKLGDQRQFLHAILTSNLTAGQRLRAEVGTTRESRLIYTSPNATPGTVPVGAPPPATQAPPALTLRKTTFLGVQDEITLAPDWELTIGLRADHYSDTGQTLNNPRLGLVWNINPQLAAKFLVGTAYRGPALNDPAAPEQLRNVEVALDYRPTESVRLVGSVYRYQSANVSLARVNNVAVYGGTQGQGTDLEWQWKITPYLRLDGGLAFVDAHDRATGARVSLIPKWSTKLGVNWSISDRWELNSQLEAYGDRVRAPNDSNRPALDDFALVNATLRYVLNSQTHLDFTVRNLLNSRAWLPVANTAEDLQLAERSLSLQLEYRF